MAKQPPFIHIIGETTQAIDNWRKVAEWLKYATTTANEVESPTTGLSVIRGKVKVNKNDTTPEYLEDKIVGGNSATFVQSNDGRGAKEIKVHSTVIEATSAPSDILAGELLFDTDARFGTPFTIGDGEAGIDYEITIDGETNDFSATWMEDEDYLKISDSLLMDAAKEIYFRDTAIHIKSGDDGHLDLTADTSIDANGLFTTTAGRIGKITTVNDTYTVLVSDETIICNKATNFTVTLPTATVGQQFTIKNINTGVVTVDGASTDTIDGSLTQSLIQWESFTLRCYVVNKWGVE